MSAIKYTPKNIIEYALVRILFKAFSALPLDVASYIGGFMARSIGPFLSAQRTARENLRRVFPDIERQKERQILLSMWDNMGRVTAEMAHLSSRTLYDRITIHHKDNMPEPGQQVLFFSAHMGNWELLSPIVYKHNIDTTLVYRKANNPLVDDFIKNIRGRQAHDLLPKGPTGAVKLVRSLKSGASMAMLIDQKMNDGIAVPFFGSDVMTAPAIAEFALRYNLPIIPARVIRTQGCHFSVTVYPEIAYTPTGDQQKDVLAIMTQINAMLEEWIKEHPDQWFWVHRRWPKN